MKLDRILLFPYYLCLKTRHFMYDHNFLLKSKEAEVPTICIGNITVGGTGKTPHTEYLVRMLSLDSYWSGRNIAVLSRGYKRKSRGFQIIPLDGKALNYGDEPTQMKRKFPEVNVAVHKKRIEACDILVHPEKKNLNIAPANVIVLDDAFQYRKLKATLNIVLIDYAHPLENDQLLPLGRLRDLSERTKSADIILVTKTPIYITNEQKEAFIKDIKLSESCKVFFTSIKHNEPQAVFPEEGDQRYVYSPKVIILSGIANDMPLRRALSDNYQIVDRISHPDHHKYGNSDIKKLTAIIKKWPTAIIITTEKDAVKLFDLDIMPLNIKQRLFYVPIESSFISESEQAEFNSIVTQAIKQ